MKTTRLKWVVVILLMTAFSGCKDVIYENDLRNVPVYLSFEELRSSVTKIESQDLVNPGKIYFKDGYIFINEEMKGIHVIDNRNPENPTNISFIKILGNMDLAIKNNILYADSYVDLVAIDISDVNNPVEVKRINNVFPYTIPELKDGSYLMAELDEKKGVVVDWEIDYSRLKVERRSYPIYSRGWYQKGYSNERMNMDLATASYSSSSGSSGSNGFTSTSTQGASFGIGGSMARFGLNGDYLYTVDSKEFHIFDVKNDQNPILENEPGAGMDIETMFIHDDHMFLGTMSGMLVFSLNDPVNPTQINRYKHIRSCDPVVVQNHIAYVTLRGGNKCGQPVSALEILSLSLDYRNADLMHSYFMQEPYGLGIDDEILFVCDGKEGLLVYEASDLATIPQKKIAQFPDINAFDVIPFNDYLFMVGSDGFYQYDYSDLQNIHQISFIPVVKDE
ncbi:MAG: hypothetical protein HQ522_00845 [Bacteroidetes bacterium]|nr:hypothetical protein [Bacteroidota bacterium]